MIINELNHNVDAYRISTFFYKNRNSRGGKIYAGPLWDCDLSFGNADYCNGWNTKGWGYDFATECPGDGWYPPFWWQKFLSDPNFVNQLKCRWEFFRKGPLSIENIYNRMDSISGYLDEAQQRNFDRWPILGTYVWPNYLAETRETYSEEVDFMKDWISDRLDWIDENIPGTCNISGISEPYFAINVFLYPNPVKDRAVLSFESDIPRDIQVTLISMNGNETTLIHQGFEPGEQILSLDFSQVENGVYLLRITDNHTIIYSTKVVKY
ncbi:MAG: T9SS type A sorting domain-containing protein [Bacteroidales bacterium]|nr:T9SS type A sorting domain-containing protein [Bacteroidales bacterium]